MADLPRPLIDAPTLIERLAARQPTRVFDVSFDLADSAAGERAHAEAHVPGAYHLHLDRDLADHAPAADGRPRGRHPLPTRAASTPKRPSVAAKAARVVDAALDGA